MIKYARVSRATKKNAAEVSKERTLVAEEYPRLPHRSDATNASMQFFEDDDAGDEDEFPEMI